MSNQKGSVELIDPNREKGLYVAVAAQFLRGCNLTIREPACFCVARCILTVYIVEEKRPA